MKIKNPQNLTYHYDLVRDYAQPSKLSYWGNLLLAASMLISAVFQLLDSYNNEYGYLLLGTWIFITIVTLLFVIVAINNMKPIGNEGKVSFLKIEDRELFSKPFRFSKTRKISLENIESHHINDKRIILKPKGEDEIFINLRQIQNPEKREELIKLIPQIIST